MTSCEKQGLLNRCCLITSSSTPLTLQSTLNQYNKPLKCSPSVSLRSNRPAAYWPWRSLHTLHASAPVTEQLLGKRVHLSILHTAGTRNLVWQCWFHLQQLNNWSCFFTLLSLWHIKSACDQLQTIRVGVQAHYRSNNILIKVFKLQNRFTYKYIIIRIPAIIQYSEQVCENIALKSTN